MAALLVVWLFALEARADDGVKWNPAWPRFRPAEVAFTAGMTLQIAASLFLYPEPLRNFEGGIGFDDAARDGLRAPTRGRREFAEKAGDYLYYALAVYPPLVDNAVVTAGIHRAGDAALQMLAINVEAYAFVGAIALSAEHLGRVRPADRGCREHPEYVHYCGDDAVMNRGLLSGHTAIGFMSAGLVCAHHAYLPLYGGGAADTLACAVALGAAATSATLRVVSDDHYASDVLLGAGVGFLGGYGVPVLLHYGAETPGRPAASFLPSLHFGADGARGYALLAPEFGLGSAGLALTGQF